MEYHKTPNTFSLEWEMVGALCGISIRRKKISGNFFTAKQPYHIRTNVLKLASESKIVSIITDGSHMVHHSINKSFLRKLGLKNVPVISTFDFPVALA